MTFTELRFVAFFALIFALHWGCRWARGRKIILLGASYAFYGAWDWRFLSLILLSTVVDYLICLRLDRSTAAGQRKLLLWSSLGLNLGLLGVFKYFNFFSTSAAGFLAWLGLPVSAMTLNLILPVGISFYTFQTLSYTIDVYRRQLTPTRNFLDFALFVAFFPQLVAGPIVRARDFLPQLTKPVRLANVRFQAAFTLFLFGFIKKACVADNVARAVDTIFADPTGFAPVMLWLGGVLYFIQIYCDFSGYSDMAIATAAMLGYTLPKNFDFPIFARSITQFWRKWHMSLSGWFRDYLYIPLGGNQRGALITYRNLWLVFFLCALWHGAAWTFVVWGTIHGLVLVLERLLRIAPSLERTPLGMIWTFAIATLAWIFFRATSLEGAMDYIGGMFGIGAGDAMLDGWRQWTVVAALFLAFHAWNHTKRVDRFLGNAPQPLFGLTLGTVTALVLPFVATSYAPFIYFQF